MPRFPEDPRVGQVIPVEPTEDLSVITQIVLKWWIPSGVAEGVTPVYGEAQAMNRVQTSARKYLLRGVICTEEIKKGDAIEVSLLDRRILSYIFLEDCGWTPKDLDEPTVRFERKGIVIQEPVLTLTTGSYSIHNEICVDLPPQEETEKEKEDERT